MLGMKVAEERRIRWKPEAIALAEQEGIDLSLLEVSLQSTVAERISMNEGALKLVRTIERGREKNGARSQPVAGTVDRR